MTAEDLSCPEASALLRQFDEYLNGLYEPDDKFLELAPEEVDGCRGIFVVAREIDAPVGCGAARRISDTTAELKRMFVASVAHPVRIVGKVASAEFEESSGDRFWQPMGYGARAGPWNSTRYGSSCTADRSPL